MSGLDVVVTQEAFGELVGITQQAVSDLVQREVLRKGDTARTWLLAYCDHLREVAAGRDPDGVLSTERARVAKETADKIALQNAVSRREFAPVGLLEVVLGDLARQLGSRLDALVPHIKRRCPELPSAVLAQITAEVTACRALCAEVNLADADRIDGDGDEGDTE